MGEGGGEELRRRLWPSTERDERRRWIGQDFGIKDVHFGETVMIFAVELWQRKYSSKSYSRGGGIAAMETAVRKTAAVEVQTTAVETEVEETAAVEVETAAAEVETAAAEEETAAVDTPAVEVETAAVETAAVETVVAADEQAAVGRKCRGGKEEYG
ncbi:hypothetical protein CBR_g23020 [Chara braunii]|uniref:Uncharacterized protein n=1 Tax=Chara braunii TaxID=69332 RepID=A0A388L3B9_CHABU|nr:hypothetical protein CBR_g23020 [Chara braunii]|eukprot:GBG76805.1 hypothetical protein CBR_g23020 [Chara braunii]